MRRLLLLLLVVTPWSRGEENPFLPSPTKGEVSLPLQDWQTVWKAASTPPAEKPANQPPLGTAVQSIVYTARLEDNTLRCDAVVQLRSFSRDWQSIPVAGGEWTLEPVTPPPGLALVRHEGRLCAVLHGEGDFELKLPLSLPLTEGGATFSLIPAAAQRFTVADVPSGRVLMFNGKAPAGKDQLCALPAQGGEVVLSLEEPKPPEPPPPPPQPSTWAADAQVVALFRDGEFECQARLYLRAAKGSGLESQLSLPAAAQVADVTGDDLLNWRAQRSPDGGQRLITLRWKTADTLDRRVTVKYTVPQSPVAGQWSLVAPQGDEKGHCVFVTAPLEGLEFSHATLLRQQATRVQAWIRELANVPELLIVEGEARILLDAKALPRAEAAKATIAEQRVATRLVADGSVLHEVHYEFNHTGPLVWRFDLPQGATLLACKVNDTDARPVQRAERQLEFALMAKGDNSTTNTISLTWHLKAAAWDKVSGQMTLELPKTDLFNQALHWQVELPEGYDIAATEGLERAAAKGGNDRTVAFQKQLFTGEAPGIDLFYQHLDLSE